MDFSIFGVQSTTLAITAALTGVLLVVGALVIAWLIGPRSYTEKKGEPFECGIPKEIEKRFELWGIKPRNAK
jgi:NADH:ubiquinone oxidoreductase subunit 3 (subunit A)